MHQISNNVMFVHCFDGQFYVDFLSAFCGNLAECSGSAGLVVEPKHNRDSTETQPKLS